MRQATDDSIDRKLVDILDEYIRLREGEASRGCDVSPADLICRYPEFGEELPGLIASIDVLHGFDCVDLSPSHKTIHTSNDDHTLRDDAAADLLPINAEIGVEDLSTRTIGDYQIVRKIGRGGMGVVYEANQVSLGRRVALKVLPLSVILDPQQVARFMVESQAAASLHHPNIIPIFSVGCEDGLHCYSMQLIDGDSLDQVLLARSRQYFDQSSTVKETIDRALSWMIQAADALEHAHQRGVIHRDIKPSNLMIDRAGKLWITDFGLARCRNDSTLTHSGALIGTWRYMSPEQTLGIPLAVDHRTDIYSLGLTLYETVLRLAGDPESESDGESIGKSNGSDQTNAFETWSLDKKSECPPSLRRLHRDVPRDLETIVMKTIAHAADERYQSAAELSRDLRRYMAGKTISARRPSLPDRIFKWTSRHRTAVLATTFAGLVALAWASTAAVMFAQQQNRLQGALHQADKNLIQANRRFEQTREVLDHFGLLAAEKLRGVSGAQAVREQLVADLLTYYERFVNDASQSDGLAEQLADTHFRAARIIDELGMSEPAMDAYSRAIEFFELHVARAEIDDESLNDIAFNTAICQNNLAVLQAAGGRFDFATDNYQSAIATQTRLQSIRPDARRELASSLANFGLMHGLLDQVERAETLLSRSLELQQADLQSEPSVSGSLAVATTLNELGFLFQADDARRSIEYNNQALELLRSQSLNDLVTSDDVSLAVDAQFAVCLNNHAALLSNLGRMLSGLDRNADSLAALERARDLIEELVQRHPDEHRYHISLGAIFNNLGRLADRSGNPSLAIDQYRQSIAHQQAAPASSPDRPSHRVALAQTYFNFERVLRQDGQFIEAEKAKLYHDSLQATGTQK